MDMLRVVALTSFSKSRSLDVRTQAPGGLSALSGEPVLLEWVMKALLATRNIIVLLFVLLLACRCPYAAEPELLARSGKGALYKLEGQRVAVLVGTPEEMGRQHGTLISDN